MNIFVTFGTQKKTKIEDKEFFKQLTKETKEYSDKIEEGFCNFCLKIYFPELSEDEIDNSLFGLNGNDDSIDAFIINEDQREIRFIQFKSIRSFKDRGSPIKKEWISYLMDIPKKLENHDYIEKHTNPTIKDIAADYAVRTKTQNL